MSPRFFSLTIVGEKGPGFFFCVQKRLYDGSYNIIRDNRVIVAKMALCNRVPRYASM